MNMINVGGGGGGDTKKVPIPKTPTSSKSASKKEMQGLILDRYETGKLLGHGTFAKVYLARNVKTNENVAIKVIDKEKILKVGLIAHIKREISILRRVRHPNIVQLFEVMATKSKIFFVMEYVKGGELFGKVAKGRLKEDVARKYFQQLISAVSFCHARGVYHRDLKPENILLDEDGNLKVSDFGLSAISDQIKQDGLFHTFCGTPAYVAPEVLARKGYDAAKVDIWSCGVILFVLIAGYLPFHDRNVMAMYKKIYRGEFRCPKWFHGELVKFFTHLLDINPQTRMTIPEIMNHRWFRKGFKQVKFYIEDDKMCSISDEVDDAMDSMDTCSETSLSESGSEKDIGTTFNSLHRPASLNAFDIISFSSGFDLSGFFEEGGEGTRFVSGATVLRIILRLEELAKVVGFTVRKKNCKINLEGPREGAKGKLTVVAEVFELTPSLRMVEVKKKAGDRSEYEEFYNSELKPVLQNLATEGAPVLPEYAEFYNYELKPELQNLATEGASERTDSPECCNYETKPGLENMPKEGASERPEYAECYNCELKPGLQNLAPEGTSERPGERYNYGLTPGLPNMETEGPSQRPEYAEGYDAELKPGLQNMAKEGASQRTEYGECYNHELKPVLQNMAEAGASQRPQYAECYNYEQKPVLQNMAEEGASQRQQYAERNNYEVKPVLQSLATEGSSDKPEVNDFYNLGLKSGSQNLTMECPVRSHLTSVNVKSESSEVTSKSIHFHEPYVPKPIAQQQRDAQAADGVPNNLQEQANNLKETIHNIQPAYQKEDGRPIVLPVMPELREVERPKQFNEFDSYGLKPQVQTVTMKSSSGKSHLDSDTQ